ncbi:uncharacterized protein RJT21DRAFT_120931 [Scheffersomyces amazonensis]|uniref:uncharacterized protein n=1 Tax=Scheffersomyces amazonensis TaxID=1078765 RepID=UPI00315D52B7
MEFSSKKRHRVPASCSVCRKRKSKCDRVKPICGTCKKKSIAHLCYYEGDSNDAPMPVNDLMPLPIPHQHHMAPYYQPVPHHRPPPPPNQLQQPHQQLAPHLPPPPAGMIQGPPPPQYMPNQMQMPINQIQPPPQQLPPHPQPTAYQFSQSESTDQDYVSPQGPHPANGGKPFEDSNNSMDKSFIKQLPGDLNHSQSSYNTSTNQSNTSGQYTTAPSTDALNNASGQFNFPSPRGSIQLSPGTHGPPRQQPPHQSPTASVTSQTQSQSGVSPNGPPPQGPGGTFLSFSSNTLVSIPLGPNSILQVNPDDRMSVFTNASYSLNLEGSLWQQQGTLSYIGLTKSDPFIKVIRNYAIVLFKSGEMAKYIKKDSIRRRKRSINGSGTLSSSSSMVGASNEGSPKKSRIEQQQSQSVNSNLDSPNSIDLESEMCEDVENEDVMEEDALIVTKIKVKSDDEDGDKNGSNNEETNTKPRNKTSTKAKGHHVKIEVKRDPDVNGPTKDKLDSSSQEVLNLVSSLRRSLFSGKKNRQEFYRIMEKVIVSILPNKLNLFSLFCRFFMHVHPFIPILDENSLLIDLNSLLDNFPNFTRDYYTDISIENENDLNIVGILLVVLRLGYMSFIHNDEVNNVYTDDEKSMIIDMKRLNSEVFTSLLNLCISDELIAVKSSFRLVQNLTLVYFYRQVAPDDCHGLGGADSNILFGVIMRHAMSIGLNRDPTFYVAHDTITKRETLINSWRRLWNYLITTDAVSAIHAGTNLNIPDIEVCDVELPLMTEDKTGEFNDTIKKIQTICESYRNIVRKINNVHNKPRVVEILLETNHLEKIFFDFFGKDFFKDFICKPAKVPSNGSSFEVNSKDHEESYLKVIKFCTFIQLRTNLSCMYYMIAIHYENEYNESRTPSMNAGIELFKIYIKSVVQLVYIMSFVLDNSVELFGKNYDYYLTANNERCMIKTHSFLTSFFARLLHYKMELTLSVGSDPSIKPRLEVTDKLFSMVLIEAELFIGNFRKLSRNYINSYKIYVMTYFVLMQCMENPSVFFQTSIQYPRFFHKGTNMLEFFTISELQYLCKLCEEFRSAKDEQTKQKIAKANQLRRTEANSKSPSDISQGTGRTPFVQPDTTNNLNASSMPGNLSANNYDLGSMPNSSLGNVPPPINATDPQLSNAGLGTGNPNPSGFNFNSYSYDDLEPANLGGEDFLKLFEVYGDLDKEI